jgi:hypothetical protein
MTDLDDIPPLTGPRPTGAGRVRRRLPRETTPFGRRTALATLAAAGGSVGLAALGGAFRPARQAIAEGYRVASYYDIYQGCPGYAAGHNCSPGCGPSVVCADCCRPSGTREGFHKSSVSHDGYKLRPSECAAGGWDGWRWVYSGACGSCARSIAWRCHDGWKRASNGSWFKTICRRRVECRS